MLQSIVTRLGAAAVVLVCTYAIVAGSWRERFGAIIYLTAYIIGLGLGLTSTAYPAFYMLLADMLCLPGFFIDGWKTPHPWPRWALAAQGVSVLTDIVAIFYKGLSRWSFLTIATVAGYAVLMSLLIGTVAYRARRRAQKQAVQ